MMTGEIPVKAFYAGLFSFKKNLILIKCNFDKRGNYCHLFNPERLNWKKNLAR